MNKEGRPSASNAAQQLASDLSSLRSRLGTLQEKARLTEARDALEDLQTRVAGLAQRLGSLRTNGYVFEKDLEGQAAQLAKQWHELQPSIQQQLSVQSAALVAALRPVEAQMAQLGALTGNPTAARPLLASTDSALGMLEDKVTAAARSIQGMYDQFDGQVYQYVRHLENVEYALTNVAEASFQLLPTEGVIAAVKTVWCKTGKEQKNDPEGVLFLTDQRVLFEQKEQVATKKVLFIATEKQKVQSLQWEAPVAMLDKVTTSKQGMLKNEDHIEVRFVSGAPLEVVHLHIWQDCDTWQALLNRAKAKEFDRTRAVPVDQAAVDKLRAAPSQCPSCGGNLSQVILRGQDKITCEYCGFVIRL
jgi:DNA repair exonuclease SbcCD ATPase subunit